MRSRRSNSEPGWLWTLPDRRRVECRTDDDGRRYDVVVHAVKDRMDDPDSIVFVHVMLRARRGLRRRRVHGGFSIEADGSMEPLSGSPGQTVRATTGRPSVPSDWVPPTGPLGRATRLFEGESVEIEKHRMPTGWHIRIADERRGPRKARKVWADDAEDVFRWLIDLSPHRWNPPGPARGGE